MLDVVDFNLFIQWKKCFVFLITHNNFCTRFLLYGVGFLDQQVS